MIIALINQHPGFKKIVCYKQIPCQTTTFVNPLFFIPFISGVDNLLSEDKSPKLLAGTWAKT